MDQAWVGVIGAAIGSAGATGAAVVAGWSGRRQASIQVSSEHEHWRRQIRRDAYGALLRASAEARDELGSLIAILRDVDVSSKRPTSRLKKMEPLVSAVRLATATVFVEGPEEILEPARRVEEGIVLLHTAVATLAKELPNLPSYKAANLLAVCSEQRVSVRIALMDFSTAARAAIDGKQFDTATASPERVVNSVTAGSEGAVNSVSTDAEGVADSVPAGTKGVATSGRVLRWLLKDMSEELDIPTAQIDPDRTLLEMGLDSRTVVIVISYIRMKYRTDIPLEWAAKLSLREIANLLPTMRPK